MADENNEENQEIDENNTENTENTENIETPPPEEDYEGLSTSDLIGIIKEKSITISRTNKEAAGRRIKNKELEEKFSAQEAQAALDAEALLKENNEYKTLYDQLKEKTADYEENKTFRANALEKCKAEVEELTEKLSDENKEIFELAAEGKNYGDQLILVKKLSKDAEPSTLVNTTQSNTRTNKKTDGDRPKIGMGSGSRSSVQEKLKELRTQKK